jgi:SAM-dependent methyltransferase
VEFLRRAAIELGAGATILDVGAGDAPYRELFDGLQYVTCDWAESPYRPPIPPDIVAPAHDIPVNASSFDAVVCTQVLEHVAEPWLVLEEFHRVIRPGGRLWLTTPLVWFLHEEPHDYYRYTSHGLRYLLARAGFEAIEVTPMNDAFTTVAELLEDLGFLMGEGHDGYDEQRGLIALTMKKLADLVDSFANFDTRRILPISFAAVATRP